VFLIEGTQQCVGEIRIVADDRYLRVISSLFANWVNVERGGLSIVQGINATH